MFTRELNLDRSSVTVKELAIHLPNGQIAELIVSYDDSNKTRRIGNNGFITFTRDEKVFIKKRLRYIESVLGLPHYR